MSTFRDTPADFPHTLTHTHTLCCAYRQMSPYSCKLLAKHFHANPLCPTGVRKSLCVRESVCLCVWQWECVSFGRLFKVDSCPRQSRLSGRRQADNGGACVCQGLHLKVTHIHTHTYKIQSKQAHTPESCKSLPTPYIYFLSLCVFFFFYYFSLLLLSESFSKTSFSSMSISLPPFPFQYVTAFTLFFPPLMFPALHSRLSGPPFHFTSLELVADSL